MNPNIFDRGFFDRFRIKKVMESYSRALFENAAQESATGQEEPINIFLSHKHDDLSEVQGIIGYLIKNYNICVYIDSQDATLPPITCVKTAERIKQKIRMCNKFIFLATEGAIESKWCNWELGYGDAYKFNHNNLAILAMKDSSISEDDYDGKEYMEMYPTIVFRDGTTFYKNSTKKIEKGLYIRKRNEDGFSIEPFESWLKNGI